MRGVRPSADGQLVEGPERPLRVPPLPAPVPGGQREQGRAGRRVRRRTGAAPANTRLHAAREGSHPLRVEQRCAEAQDSGRRNSERRVKAIRQKLDRLDEAFLYPESIDLDTYSRQRDKLREELTLSKIDHHTEAVDELDVEGILAFAERILPRASDLWVQASLDYKQRCSSCSSPKESRTTEIALIEPP